MPKEKPVGKKTGLAEQGAFPGTRGKKRALKKEQATREGFKDVVRSCRKKTNFNSKMDCPQNNWLPELVDRDREQSRFPVILEEVGSDRLCHLDIHESVGGCGCLNIFSISRSPVRSF